MRSFFGDLTEDTCASHLIPPEALKALMRRDYQTFIASRLNALAEYEARFIRPLVDVFEEGYSSRVAQLL